MFRQYPCYNLGTLRKRNRHTGRAYFLFGKVRHRSGGGKRARTAIKRCESVYFAC